MPGDASQPLMCKAALWLDLSEGLQNDGCDDPRLLIVISQLGVLLGLQPSPFCLWIPSLRTLRSADSCLKHGELSWGQVFFGVEKCKRPAKKAGMEPS